MNDRKIKVKISCLHDMPPLLRQLPDKSTILGNCEFLINTNERDCDFFFVLHGVERSEPAKCPSENVVLVTGEPESVFRYPSKYLKQFGCVLTCQQSLLKKKKTLKSIPASPWFVGAKMLSRNPWVWDEKNYLDYNYFHLKNADNHIDKLAIITSNKTITKGHRRRLDFIYKLKEFLPDLVDIYGSGFTPIKDKYEIYSKYKYALIIENSSYPDYWTEKIADCYLSNCFPFYIGCPNIKTYFPDSSLEELSFDNLEYAVKAIKEAIMNDRYNRVKLVLKEAKRMVLDKYNIFFVILQHIEQFDRGEHTLKESIQINPVTDFTSDWGYRINNRIIRLIKG